MLQRDNLYGIFDLTSSGINQGWAHLGHSDNRCGPGFIEANTGLVEIDWNQADPTVRMSIHDDSGKERIMLQLQKSALTFDQRNVAPVDLQSLDGVTWQSTFGEITFRRDQQGAWSAKYGKGTAVLKVVGDSLEGEWTEGNRSGACRFVPSRCGQFILGTYSRGDGPLLLAWPCWKTSANYQNDIER